jgi:hypothetical protein
MIFLIHIQNLTQTFPPFHFITLFSFLALANSERVSGDDGSEVLIFLPLLNWKAEFLSSFKLDIGGDLVKIIKSLITRGIFDFVGLSSLEIEIVRS